MARSRTRERYAAMNVVALAWVMLTPYCTGVLVGNSARVNRVVARNLVASTALGWIALATVVVAIFVVGSSTATLVALAGAPLGGLAFWPAAPGRGGDGPPPPEPPDDQPSPDERVDWDEF